MGERTCDFEVDHECNLVCGELATKIDSHGCCYCDKHWPVAMRAIAKTEQEEAFLTEHGYPHDIEVMNVKYFTLLRHLQQKGDKEGEERLLGWFRKYFATFSNEMLADVIENWQAVLKLRPVEQGHPLVELLEKVLLPLQASRV